jgi:hypothetical protein
MLGCESRDEGMSMVSRRGVLGGVAAAAAMVLSGCGRLMRGKDVSTEAEEAAAAVDGVVSVELEQKAGANFERLLTGTVSLETEDREAGIEVYDEAMRAVITVIHDELDDAEARTLRVGGVSAVLADGTELDVFVLDPATKGEDPRIDQITARSLYSRYGLG